MRLPNYDDIVSAYRRIRNVVHATPIMTSTTLNERVGAKVFLKCENLQRVGAFKFRGAYNAVAQVAAGSAAGILAHSSGNHAQAVALAAKLHQLPALIVMPEDASPAKIEATKGYGAKIVFCPPTQEGREQTAARLAQETGYTLIHPYDNPHIIAGAGTVAMELLSDLLELNRLYCPIGGGGLISGTALAAKALVPSCKIIGVEPAGADDAYQSFKSGKLCGGSAVTIADGLKATLSDLTFRMIQKYVDDVITVDDSEILSATRFLWERQKLVVEPSGAVPVAGAIKDAERCANQRVGVILSGGNVNMRQFFERWENLT